jgi:hypothetical protein
MTVQPVERARLLEILEPALPGDRASRLFDVFLVLRVVSTSITPLGKLFGSVVTVLGIGMFALPAGILATGFAQEIKHRELLTTWNLVAGCSAAIRPETDPS